MTTTKKRNLSPLFMLTAAVCFSLGGVLVKLVPWGAMAISGARSLIAAIEIAIYMKLRGHKLVLNKSTVLGGCVMGISSILYVAANKLTTAANTILLQYTAPIFIMFYLWVFFGEKPGKRDVIFTAITSAGVILFFVDSLSGGGMTGNILAVLSGMTYAVVFLMKKLPESDNLSMVFCGCVFGAITGVPFLFGENEFTVTSICGVLVIGLVQFGCSYICMAEGLQKTPPLTASLIMMLEPILNPILAALVIGEFPGPIALVGAVIVVGAVLWNNLKQPE